MVILVSKNLPKRALKALASFGGLTLFQTDGITYPAISGHPDIFFCPVGDGLVVAPNVPKAFKIQLSKQNLSWKEGLESVGRNYPETACYNCVVTEDFLIGNKDFVDKKIWKYAGDKEFIHVKQGYTRCNLLPLANNRFITSDKGIEKTLTEKNMEVLYVNPMGILLPGFEHGFIGGCCGVSGNKVFFIGNLNHYTEGERIKSFLSGYEIAELYDGPLFDGGGLFFLNQP
jgi:hypothetical protein